MQLRVDGSWSGWDGNTVVRLTDGSLWEQVQYRYEYRYAYRPKARVERNVMFVEGTSQGVKVRRIS